MREIEIVGDYNLYRSMLDGIYTRNSANGEYKFPLYPSLCFADDLVILTENRILLRYNISSLVTEVSKKKEEISKLYNGDILIVNYKDVKAVYNLSKKKPLTYFTSALYCRLSKEECTKTGGILCLDSDNSPIIISTHNHVHEEIYINQLSKSFMFRKQVSSFGRELVEELLKVYYSLSISPGSMAINAKKSPECPLGEGQIQDLVRLIGKKKDDELLLSFIVEEGIPENLYKKDTEVVMDIPLDGVIKITLKSNGILALTTKGKYDMIGIEAALENFPFVVKEEK